MDHEDDRDEIIEDLKAEVERLKVENETLQQARAELGEAQKKLWARIEAALEPLQSVVSKLESQIARNPNLPGAYKVILRDGFTAIRALMGGRECPNALLPDGPVCPRCGGKRAPSGVDGGSWVHTGGRE